MEFVLPLIGQFIHTLSVHAPLIVWHGKVASLHYSKNDGLQGIHMYNILVLDQYL